MFSEAVRSGLASARTGPDPRVRARESARLVVSGSLCAMRAEKPAAAGAEMAWAPP